LLKPVLIDQDPFSVSELWHTMRNTLNGRSGGILFEAIAGVDIALWDIMGKALSVNIATLLGGRNAKTVPAYASSIMVSNDTEKEALRLLQLGFNIIKMKIGNGIATDLERVAHLRKIVGDDIKIVTDVNYIYHEDEAEQLAHYLAEYDVCWLEEPIRPENREGYKRLAQRSPVPLAAGESEFTARDFSDLIACGAVKFVQPDVSRSGGITETRNIALLADAFHLWYAPHVGFSGIVCLAATLQLAAALPNLFAYECMINPNPFREELAIEPVGLAEQLIDGDAEVPQNPGLGIELNWEAVERMRIRT
jgi:D-galactarolactone cycloisomerase